MTEEELGRLLGEAFDARARTLVPDDAVAPARRAGPTADLASASRVRHRRWQRVAAPLAAAAAVLVAVGIGVGLAGSSDDGTRNTPIAGPSTSRPPATSSPALAPPGATAVRVVAARAAAPAAQVGVGMPVVARFSAAITDARGFATATTVTVDGRPVDARWYFVRSTVRGYPIEGHLRPRQYWPAHATVRVTVRANRLSAGTGFGFANDFDTTFVTGARTVATVDNRTHLMTVSRDGQVAGRFRVSLGAARTPTRSGIKVIIAKSPSVCMHDVNGTFYECGIRDAQQLTYSGEYLHAAPWNVLNIGVRNTSNGCTNLRPADAATLYRTLEVGDIVSYVNTDGAPMAIGDGIGDWDVPWATWVTGGLVPTR